MYAQCEMGYKKFAQFLALMGNVMLMNQNYSNFRSPCKISWQLADGSFKKEDLILKSIN